MRLRGSFRSSGAEETEALGARLADSLALGDVVLVEGELGAGKTTFVRGAARRLGVNTPVTSPTFTIGQRYRGSELVVSHLDLYRVTSLAGEEPELLDDYVGPDTVSFVEWPGEAAATLAGLACVAARVSLEHGGEDLRLVTIR
jgi:tRNA threonylcarbamoyladenosine biosynthesis protein TsaE